MSILLTGSSSGKMLQTETPPLPSESLRGQTALSHSGWSFSRRMCTTASLQPGNKPVNPRARRAMHLHGPYFLRDLHFSRSQQETCISRDLHDPERSSLRSHFVRRFGKDKKKKTSEEPKSAGTEQCSRHQTGRETQMQKRRPAARHQKRARARSREKKAS